MRKFSYKNLFKKLIDLDMTNGKLIKKRRLVKVYFEKRRMTKILLLTLFLEYTIV